MQIVIGNVLSADEIETRAQDARRRPHSSDGRETAGFAARR